MSAQRNAYVRFIDYPSLSLNINEGTNVYLTYIKNRNGVITRFHIRQSLICLKHLRIANLKPEQMCLAIRAGGDRELRNMLCRFSTRSITIY